MYRYSYNEILADNAMDARAAERRALDRAIELLQTAGGSAPKSRQETEALDFTSSLWGLFVKSLASEDNDLPKPLRANLISVGLGVLAEIARIEAGQSRDLAALADICGIIRDGLA